MELLRKVFDRLPFSLILAAAVVVLFAWLLKTHGGWENYRPVLQSRGFLAVAIFLLFNSLAFEATRLLIAKFTPTPSPLMFITDSFQPVARPAEGFPVRYTEGESMSSELVLAFRLVNTSPIDSFDLVRVDVESLGILLRREALLALRREAQYSIEAFEDNEDLGVLIFSFGPATHWGRLGQQLSFVPPARGLRYGLGTAQGLPVLPLDKRIQILPRQTIALRIQVKCARSKLIQDERSIVTRSSFCQSPSGYEVIGFMTKPEYPFRLVVEAISGRGERVSLASDFIYAVAPRPLSNYYGVVGEGALGPERVLGENLTTVDQANQVATLLIDGSFSGSYKDFLHHVVQDYVMVADELEHLRTPAQNRQDSALSVADVVTDFCAGLEHSEGVRSSQDTQVSNVAEFLRGLERRYPKTRRIIAEFANDSTLPQRNRVKSTWLMGELGE